ncbi:WhiB family transcriptional regulator [Streptomyces olivaceus]|uniref:WhiB family transcriptional regulator n=1 Tax=Streptomyces olivaceus TaxID=47716 RepID=UPI001CCC0769|nr:WhiB family transcriptional regulator [Streptomyces olivaceus]MBZ6250527.1 WhiB family transcriptional regulator [Streptomyces olivaceus]
MRTRQTPANTRKPPSWDRDAACARLTDPEIMFPGNEPQAIAAAREVCAGCPVQRACLRNVITSEGARRGGARHGIVAGLTGHERWLVYRTLKRRGQLR